MPVDCVDLAIYTFAPLLKTMNRQE
eukprot:SAG31_NODE_42145_length_273_cov_0.563218_1_plen_24_part_10